MRNFHKIQLERSKTAEQFILNGQLYANSTTI